MHELIFILLNGKCIICKNETLFIITVLSNWHLTRIFVPNYKINSRTWTRSLINSVAAKLPEKAFNRITAGQDQLSLSMTTVIKCSHSILKTIYILVLMSKPQQLIYCKMVKLQLLIWINLKNVCKLLRTR